MNENKIKSEINYVIEKIKSCELEKNSEQYINLLVQTYFFVKHSIPLLKYAIKYSQNSDFIKRSEDHIKEEHAHDLMILKDLEKLNVIPGPEMEWEWTKNFYSNQYHLIEKYDGEILLGYILALEAIAVNSYSFLNSLQARYGKNSTRFVHVHVEEDVEHLPQAIHYANNSRLKKEIFQNFKSTLNEYSAFLDLLKKENKAAA